MYKSPSSREMKFAGWSETHGIALWTNPFFPGVFIDTNTDVITIFPDGVTKDDNGEELSIADDALHGEEETEAMILYNLPLVVLKFGEV